MTENVRSWVTHQSTCISTTGQPLANIKSELLEYHCFHRNHRLLQLSALI